AVYLFFVPERRNSAMLNLAPIGIGANLLNRLAAIGDLHQFGGAAGADADLGLEQLLPLGPVAGVLLLERREVLAGGDVVLLSLVLGFVAFLDMRLDSANQLRLVHSSPSLIRSASFALVRLTMSVRLPSRRLIRYIRGHFGSAAMRGSNLDGLRDWFSVTLCG